MTASHPRNRPGRTAPSTPQTAVAAGRLAETADGRPREAPSEAGRPAPGRTRLLLATGLSVLTLAAFAAVRHHGFVSVDDHIYVTANAHVVAGLSWSGVAWAFTTGYANFWHPLTWLSLMLDVQLFGVNSAGYHLTNLIFHIANTLLLFIVLKKMTNALWQSAFVAALFALHPLHVESVAWLSERKDVLSTLFWMLTVIYYV